ncbi:hypothetical protein ACHAWF_011716 [Thalassiosira exigua]
MGPDSSDSAAGASGGGSSASVDVDVDLLLDPSLVANVPSRRCRRRSRPRRPSTMLLPSLLPGPFVVLQGSPGDGMANTIDALPALPPPSAPPPRPPAARSRCDSNPSSGGSGGGRRPSMPMLEELSSDDLPESGEEGGEEGDGGDDGDRSKQRAVSLDEGGTGCSAAERGAEPRRSSGETEGGLHLPLASSPLMRRQCYGAVASAAAGMMLGGGYGSPRKEGASVASASAAEATSVPAPPFSDEAEGRAAASSAAAPLSKRTRASDDLFDQGEGRDEATTSSSSSDDPRRRPSKTPAEIHAVEEWHRECREQEDAHREEGRQNVRLLLQRRRRARDRHSRGGGGGASDGGTGVGSGGSPPPPDGDEREENRTEKRRDPIDRALDEDELAYEHRTWYQRDGRLVVLRALPTRGGGGGAQGRRGEATAAPVRGKGEFLSPEDFSDAPFLWLPGGFVAAGRTAPILLGAFEKKEGDIPSYAARALGKFPTLPPGCTVVAESAYVLDSRTLRQLHPPPSPANGGAAASDDDANADGDGDPELAFLKISSPVAGYVLSSVHGYPLLLPGLPAAYCDAASWWPWRVSCRPDGAFVRRGLELVSDKLGTLPHGTVADVKGKRVNEMGLNRLRVRAYVDAAAGTDDGEEEEDGGGGGGERDGTRDDDAARALGMTRRSGYVSEFLNPLSGQRGPVVAPVPLPVPALYRVVHPGGCVVRAGVELSASRIGHAPEGTTLRVTGRAYTDHPADWCVERLRLAGGGGWVSTKLNRPPPGDDALVEMAGTDGDFDPEDPGGYHMTCLRRVADEFNGGGSRSGSDDDGATATAGERRVTYRRASSYANLSEIGDDGWEDPPARRTSSSEPDPAGATTTEAAGVPALFRGGAAGNPGGGDGRAATAAANPMDAIRASSSGGRGLGGGGPLGRDAHPNRCLICLSDERTATIVHGSTGHIACCLTCARILKARGDNVSLFRRSARRLERPNRRTARPKGDRAAGVVLALWFRIAAPCSAPSLIPSTLHSLPYRSVRCAGCPSTWSSSSSGRET